MTVSFNIILFCNFHYLLIWKTWKKLSTFRPFWIKSHALFFTFSIRQYFERVFFNQISYMYAENNLVELPCSREVLLPGPSGGIVKLLPLFTAPRYRLLTSSHNSAGGMNYGKGSSHIASYAWIFKEEGIYEGKKYGMKHNLKKEKSIIHIILIKIVIYLKYAHKK